MSLGYRYVALLTALPLGCDAPAQQAPRAEALAPSGTLSASRPASVLAPSAAPSAAPQATAQPAVLPSPPAVVDVLAVPSDIPAYVVRAADGKPPRIVFFPGICSNASAYLAGFKDAARDHGGAIAIDGDRPCGHTPGFKSITSDPVHEEPRIDAALRAAGVESPETADVVFVGYSLGATLIENLVRKSPARYRRVALIGSPRDPRLDRLRGASAVATMSCSLDVPWRMKGATRILGNAGVASKYFEMPGCTHGMLADGERVFGEVFTWLGLER